MSVPLVALIFWLVMTVAGLLIWRSGDRIGGRSIAFPAAISSAGAAGMWLVGLAFVWLGYLLMACTVGIWMVVLWRADRAVLRRMAPVLLLGAAVIAAISLTELASWIGASRDTILALLVLIVVLTTAFIAWMLASTFRFLWPHLRANRLATRTDDSD